MGAHKAYAQGDLDNLCGLYAVVNAVRYALRHSQQLRGRDCLWLFAELINLLAQWRILDQAITDGLNQRHVSVLLARARMLVAGRFQAEITLNKPFHRMSRVPLTEMVRTVRRHQKKAGAAVLIGFGGHWSVVRGTSKSGFLLLDSASYRYLSFKEIVVGPPRNREDLERHWFVAPSSLFFLRSTVDVRE